MKLSVLDKDKNIKRVNASKLEVTFFKKNGTYRASYSREKETGMATKIEHTNTDNGTTLTHVGKCGGFSFAGTPVTPTFYIKNTLTLLTEGKFKLTHAYIEEQQLKVSRLSLPCSRRSKILI